MLNELVGRQERVLLKQIVDTQRGACPVALCRNPLSVFLEQIDNPGGGLERLIGRVRNTGKEEIEPGFPCPVLAHLLKQAVIVGAMRFQIQAQIEERLAQHTVDAQVQRYQQATDPAVSIQERVDGLELDMQQPGLDQCGQTRAILVYEALKRIETSIHLGRRWRHEQCVAWT